MNIIEPPSEEQRIQRILESANGNRPVLEKLLREVRIGQKIRMRCYNNFEIFGLLKDKYALRMEFPTMIILEKSNNCGLPHIYLSYDHIKNIEIIE